MPDDRHISADYSEREDIDLRGLIRLASWGAAAAAALLLAVFATRSELGTRRMAAVFGSGSVQQTVRIPPEPALAAARAAELEFETRQLATSVRSLSTDRDRLLARVTVLERSLEDVTGSIARAPAKAALQDEAGSKADPATRPEAAKSEVASPAILPMVVGPTVIATISSPLFIPSPSAETLARVGLSAIPILDEDNTATRTDFGVDIGGGLNIKTLRTAWSTIRQNHGDLFEGMYPVIAIREGRPVELRLVIGPLVNAAAAARLCGKVANAGLSCQPAIFDGQRLALR
jgi:hypothetical protein